jgi:carbonic anhydrase
MLQGFGALAACTPCLPAAAAQEKPGEHGGRWDYKAAERWGELSPRFGVCAQGLAQSPVDLRGGTPARLPDVQPSYREMPLRVVNNGHTIQVNCEPGSGVAVDGVSYRLLQFHFHHPGEHLVNGRSFDLELHFVNAADSGSLAVLGVFFQAGPANATLARIWSAMPRTEGPERAAGAVISPADLLPAERGYFRYMGSLTTPPCFETVTWTVFKTPVAASPDQLREFAALFPMNARPPQRLNRRFLLETL